MGRVRGLHSPYLLTGVLCCGVCGAHFAGRPGAKRKAGGRPYYYGCGFHASRGPSVCRNRTLLPREGIERELLDLLLGTILTPLTLDRLLDAVNCRLRAQTDATRPKLRELRAALARTAREIENYTRAVAQGDFSSLAHALREAEARREVLRREIEQLQGAERAVLQLTRQALERHLEGLTEKLRSGDKGRVREAIRESVERIVVGGDGTLSMEIKPGGLLGGQAPIAHLGCRGTGPLMERTIQSATGRQWKVIGTG